MTKRSLCAAARIAGAVLGGWLALGLAPATPDAAPAAVPAASGTNYIWQPSHGPTGGSILGLGIGNGPGGQHAITAVNGALFATTLGASPVWAPVSLGSFPASISFTGFGASPNFAQDGRLYVSGYTSGTSDPEFYISSDGGQSWSLNTTIACGAARVSPNFATDHFMIAGCATNSVMLSTDSGASWGPRSVGFSGAFITDVEFSPAFAVDQTIIAVANGAGMWISTNQGMNWSPYSPLGFGSSFRQISLSPSWSVDHILYAAAYPHFIRIDQNSFTFEDVPAGSGSPFAIVLAPDFPSSQRVIAGTSQATFISSDGGAHWASPLPFRMTDIVWSPAAATDHTGWMLTDGAGILQTTDDGATWAPINTGLIGARVSDIAAVPASPTVLAAVKGNGVFISRNGGMDWSWASQGITNSAMLSVGTSPDFDQDGIAFAGSDGSGVFRTQDGGAHWHPIGPDVPFALSVVAMDVSPNFASDHLVMAGAGSGVYRSLNGGDVWTKTESTSGVYALALSPNFTLDGVALAGTVNGVMLSSDRGASWNYSNTGLPTNQVPYGPDVTAVMFSPQFASDQTAYIGTLNSGVFRSTNGGASWAPAYSGLLHPDVLALGWLTGTAAAPQVVVSARLNQNYALYTSASPTSWSPTTTPFEPWRAVNALRPGSGATTALLAGTDGRGVWFYRTCTSCVIYLPAIARP